MKGFVVRNLPSTMECRRCQTPAMVTGQCLSVVAEKVKSAEVATMWTYGGSTENSAETHINAAIWGDHPLPMQSWRVDGVEYLFLHVDFIIVTSILKLWRDCNVRYLSTHTRKSDLWLGALYVDNCWCTLVVLFVDNYWCTLVVHMSTTTNAHWWSIHHQPSTQSTSTAQTLCQWWIDSQGLRNTNSWSHWWREQV